jgi:GNAT superfamily N-acetyltransferase
VVKRKVAKNTEFVKDPNEILKLLHMGTNLLLWPEFNKYILFDLKHFNARSVLLAEEGVPVGHALIFNEDQETLFFGFFGVSNDEEDRIKFLMEKLIEFAEKNGYSELRGPVNVPTIIYGWGFMEEGSSTSYFVHKPINLPIYPKIFRQKGFSEILKEYSFEGYLDQVPPRNLEPFVSNDYELVVFNSWEEIEAIKMEFLKLNVRNLPPKSVVTPVSGPIFDNYFGFIKQYGDPSMMVFAKFKKTNKIIGCFVGTPNPFSKDSFVLLTLVLDKKHRNKGLAWWMIKELFANSLKRGINYCTTFVGSHVDSTNNMSVKLGFSLERTHTIFSYAIKNKS